MARAKNHHRPAGVHEAAIPMWRTMPPGEQRPVEWLIECSRRIGWQATAIGAVVDGDQVMVWAVPPSKKAS